MGILDSKSRILDVIITQEGRRQISDGKMIIEHASFSDDGTFYRADAISGSMDASSRIFFEATSQRQDRIALEADDSGLLLPFPQTSGYEIVNGGILSGTIGSRTTITGSAFSSLSENVLNTSLQNFTELMTIATHDEVFDDSSFKLSTNSLTFSLTSENPIANHEMWTVNINDADNLIEDQRFSDVENFMYLPPISKLNEGEDTSKISKSKRLARYARLTPKKYDIEKFENDLTILQKRGLHNSVQFYQSSRKSRLMIQVFEKLESKMKKLDVYKYASFNEKKSSSQTDVYFVGKLVSDQNGSYTFIHLFTLAFR